jgi:hypothetical protein
MKCAGRSRDGDRRTGKPAQPGGFSLRRVGMLSILPLACMGAHAAQPAVGSLCHAPETTYFSCRTARHKTVSLCGNLPSSLQYRYGKPVQVALRFPADAALGSKQLGYAHYSRYQTERTEITFSHVDTDYSVFDYTEDGVRHAGVRIAMADGREREIRCAGPIRGELAPLGKSLRCDSDNALNGGQCP